MSTAPQQAQAARTGGWSETWYDLNDGTASNAQKTRAGQYAIARALLLPRTAALYGIRFTDLGTKESGFLDYHVSGLSGSITDLPQTSLLLRFDGAVDANHRMMFLHCIPDGLMLGGEFNKGVAAAVTFQQNLSIWMNYIATNYVFFGVDLTIPRMRISSIDASGNVRLKDPISGFAAGDQLKLYRVQLDGTCCGIPTEDICKVVTDPWSFTLQNWAHDVGKSAHGGEVGKLPAIGSVAVEGGWDTSNVPTRVYPKKVGRPFGLWRGRRSPTCCRCD